MGLAQIATLKQRAIKLRRNNNLYKKYLKNLNEIKIIDFNFSEGEVPLWTDAFAFKKRDKLIDFLKKNGVECRKFWYPLHFQRPFKQPDYKYKVASSIYKKLFWLPSSLNLTENDIRFVSKLIKNFYLKN